MSSASTPPEPSASPSPPPISVQRAEIRRFLNAYAAKSGPSNLGLASPTSASPGSGGVESGPSPFASPLSSPLAGASAGGGPSSSFDPFGTALARSGSDDNDENSPFFRCVLDARWFKQWKTYVNYSSTTSAAAKKVGAGAAGDSSPFLSTQSAIDRVLLGEDPKDPKEEEEEEEGENEKMKVRLVEEKPTGESPGPIPNDFLVLEGDGDRDPDTDSLPKLIPSLSEHKDFVAVPIGAWDALVKWYGGGPRIVRRYIGDPRLARPGASGLVEYFPFFFTLVLCEEKDGQRGKKAAKKKEIMIGAEVVMSEFCAKVKRLGGKRREEAEGEGESEREEENGDVAFFWMVCEVEGRLYRRLKSNDAVLLTKKVSEVFFRRTGQTLRIIFVRDGDGVAAAEESPPVAPPALWTVPPIIVQGTPAGPGSAADAAAADTAPIVDDVEEEEGEEGEEGAEQPQEEATDTSTDAEESQETDVVAPAVTPVAVVVPAIELTEEQKMIYSRFRFEDSDLWGGEPMAIRGATGLKNLGNTCYMNAALQALSSIKPMREFFYGENPPYGKHIMHAKTSGRLSHAFARLLRMLWCGKFGWVSPRECRFLVQRLLHSRFSGSDENDASELLQGLIYQLHCDLKQKHDSELLEDPMSPVSELSEDIRTDPDRQWREFLKLENSFLFRLMLKQDRSVQGCHCESTTYYETDISMRLQMPVLKTLQVKFNDPEKIQPALLDFEIDDESITIAELIQRRETEKKEESEAPDYVIAKEKNRKIIGFLPKDSVVKDLMLERFFHNLIAFESTCSEGEEFIQVRVCRRRVFDRSYVACTDPLLVPFNVERDPPSLLFTKIRLMLSRFERAEKRFVGDSEEEASLFNTPPIEGLPRVVSYGTLFRLAFDDAEDANLNLDEIYYTTEGRIDFQHRLDRKVCVLMAEYKFRNHYSPTWMRASSKGTVRALRQFTLHELIQNYAKPEIYNYFCDHCHRSKRKKLDLWRLPEVLVISFKRFDAFQRKIRTFVKFPLEGLGFAGLSPSPHVQNSVYDLIATIAHTGEMYGGHYTVMSKLDSEDGPVWVRLDDERTAIADVGEIVSDKAYVLFYQRRPVQEESD